MTQVRIELEGGTLGLSASGGIFVSPVSDGSQPIPGGDHVVVRATMSWSRPLAPDLYEYRYRLANGSGKYKLKLFVAAELTPRVISEERDAANQIGNRWEFEVPVMPTGDDS